MRRFGMLLLAGLSVFAQAAGAYTVDYTPARMATCKIIVVGEIECIEPIEPRSLNPNGPEARYPHAIAHFNISDVVRNEDGPIIQAGDIIPVVFCSSGNSVYPPRASITDIPQKFSEGETGVAGRYLRNGEWRIVNWSVSGLKPVADLVRIRELIALAREDSAACRAILEKDRGESR